MAARSDGHLQFWNVNHRIMLYQFQWSDRGSSWLTVCPSAALRRVMHEGDQMRGGGGGGRMAPRPTPFNEGG